MLLIVSFLKNNNLKTFIVGQGHFKYHFNDHFIGDKTKSRVLAHVFAVAIFEIN